MKRILVFLLIIILCVAPALSDEIISEPVDTEVEVLEEFDLPPEDDNQIPLFSIMAEDEAEPQPGTIILNKTLINDVWHIRCDVMDGTNFHAGGGIWKTDVIMNPTKKTSLEGHRSNKCGDADHWIIWLDNTGTPFRMDEIKSGATGGTLPTMIFKEVYSPADLGFSGWGELEPEMTDKVELYKENFKIQKDITTVVPGERIYWVTWDGSRRWYHSGIPYVAPPTFIFYIDGEPYPIVAGNYLELEDVEPGAHEIKEDVSLDDYIITVFGAADTEGTTSTINIIDGETVEIEYINERIVPDPTDPPAPPPVPTATPSPTPDPTDEPDPTESPTPSPTPDPTESPTPSPSPSPTPTITPTLSPSPSPTPTITPTPSPTPSPTPTPTLTPTPTPTPSPTPSPSPTIEITPNPSPIPTEEVTSSPLPTPTEEVMPSSTPTNEPTPEITEEPTPSPSPIPTITPEITDDPTPTPTVLPTDTPTPIPTDSPAPTASPTSTPTVVPTVTPTIEPTITPTPTNTLEPTVSPTLQPTTATPKPTPTLSPTNTPPTSTPIVKPTSTLTPTVKLTPKSTPQELPPQDLPTPKPTPSPSPTPEPTPTPRPTLAPEQVKEIIKNLPEPYILGPHFETLTEAEIEDLMDIFDYNTPLYGMLPTGDETPPYITILILIGLACSLIYLALKR